MVVVIKQIGILTGSHLVADFNLSLKGIPLKFAYSMYAFILGEMTYPFEIVAIIVLGGIASVFIAGAPIRRWLSHTSTVYALGFVTVSILFTSLVTTFLSTHTSFIYTPSRTFFALPFLLIAFGVLHATIRKPLLQHGLFLMFMLANLYGINNWITNRHFMMPVYAIPWKEVMEDLRGKDGMIFSDESLCYEYYRNHLDGVYPDLMKSASFQDIAAEIRERLSNEEPLSVFVVLTGRESTGSEVDKEIVTHLATVGKRVSQRKYLFIDEDYRSIKSKLTGRDSYDAKLTLFEYELWR
jgi:hypothetical protein